MERSRSIENSYATSEIFFFLAMRESSLRENILRHSKSSNEGCSKSNASYFIMLVSDFRGRCWWYGSRAWTFLPIFYYILLPCDSWEQRGSLTERCLTWKRVWSKGADLNSFIQKNKQTNKQTTKKLHPLTFIDACWTFLETKQWMWAQWGSRWCISALAVCHLHWCRYLQALHVSSCSSLVKMHSQWWWLCWKIVFLWSLNLS